MENQKRGNWREGIALVDPPRTKKAAPVIMFIVEWKENLMQINKEVGQTGGCWSAWKDLNLQHSPSYPPLPKRMLSQAELHTDDYRFRFP